MRFQKIDLRTGVAIKFVSKRLARVRKLRGDYGSVVHA
jgi:hypothetical protein